MLKQPYAQSFSVIQVTTDDPDFSPTEPSDSPAWGTTKEVLFSDLTAEVAGDLVLALNAMQLLHRKRDEWYSVKAPEYDGPDETPQSQFVDWQGVRDDLSELIQQVAGVVAAVAQRISGRAVTA